MQKIFKEYGIVIVVAMAVVALIGVVAILLGGNGGGVIGGALQDIVNKNDEVVGDEMEYIGWRDPEPKYDALKGGAYYKVLSVAMADANAGNTDNGTDEREGAVAYVKVVDGESVLSLLQDQEATEVLPVTGNVVFNLRGKTLSMGSGVYFNATGGSFMLRDGSGYGGIVKTATNASLSNDFIIDATASCANVIVDGGDFDCDIDNGSGTFTGIRSLPPLTVSYSNFDIDVADGGLTFAIRGGNESFISNTDIDVDIVTHSNTACAINLIKGDSIVDDVNIDILAQSTTGTKSCEGMQIGSNASVTVQKANIVVDGAFCLDDDLLDARGFGVVNYGTLTLKGDRSSDIKVTATREAIVAYSDCYIYNGTYKGCQHGGLYVDCSEGRAPEVKIYGGKFQNVRYTGENELYRENAEMYAPRGAVYLYGDCENWIMDVQNAVIDGGRAPYGLALNYAPNNPGVTVNLTNCTLSGAEYDLRVDERYIVNLYEGTVLKHNTIAVSTGIVNDNR